jgi:hypothetical protein
MKKSEHHITVKTTRYLCYSSFKNTSHNNVNALLNFAAV